MSDEMKRHMIMFVLGGVLMLILLSALSSCAPIGIAVGVEVEHDIWCQTHQTDVHCR